MTAETIARLRISLDDIRPEIWRVVEIQTSASLKAPHRRHCLPPRRCKNRRRQTEIDRHKDWLTPAKLVEALVKRIDRQQRRHRPAAIESPPPHGTTCTTASDSA